MEFTQEQKFYAQIVQKAWEDAEFKKELVANPVAAIEKFTGKKMNLPAGKTLVVKDQSDDSAIYINIPASAKKYADTELTDEQLEAAAGGVIDGGCFPPDFPGGIWHPTPTFPTDLLI